SSFVLDAAGETEGEADGDTAVVQGADVDGVTTFTVGARDVEHYRGDLQRALDDVKTLQRAGWRLVLTTEGHGPAKRMVEQLSAEDTAARLVAELGEEPTGGVVLVAPALVGQGFVAPDLRLAVFSESDLTGRQGSTTRDMRKMPS